MSKRWYEERNGEGKYKADSGVTVQSIWSLRREVKEDKPSGKVWS